MIQRLGLAIVSAGMAATLVACGDDDGSSTGFDSAGVDFRGNVSSVTTESSSSTCSVPDADLIACSATGAGESEDGGCTETELFCLPVASDCTFGVGVPITCVEFAGVFFVEDANRNGTFDQGEREAGAVFSCSSDDPENCAFPMCNGDEWLLLDVEIEYFAEPIEGSTGVTETRETRRTARGECATPTPTVAPTPTPTPEPLLPFP